METFDKRMTSAVRRAVRSGDLKYSYQRVGGGQPEEHLFDLGRDPAEKHDLLAHRPEALDRLRRLLAEWEAEVRPTRPELLR